MDQTYTFKPRSPDRATLAEFAPEALEKDQIQTTDRIAGRRVPDGAQLTEAKADGAFILAWWQASPNTRRLMLVERDDLEETLL